MDELRVIGSACEAWVWDAIYRTRTAADPQRPARLPEVTRRFTLAERTLEAYAQWQHKAQSIAVSSTAVAELRRVLRFIGAPERGGELEDASDRVPGEALLTRDELAPLASLELHVELLSVRGSVVGYDHAVLLLREGPRAWTLHVWNPLHLDGVWQLERARVSHADGVVRIEGPDGALTLRGTPILEAGASAEPGTLPSDVPDPQHSETWVEAEALLEALNGRARWDYELEGDRRRGRLALRGRSSAYEEGCHIILRDVYAARVPCGLSHPKFRWLQLDQLPPALRPPTTGWFALGIDADVHGDDVASVVLVARGILYADPGQPTRVYRVGEGSDR